MKKHEVVLCIFRAAIAFFLPIISAFGQSNDFTISKASNSFLTDPGVYAEGVRNSNTTAGNAVGITFGIGSSNWTDFIAAVKTSADNASDTVGDLVFGGSPSVGTSFVERMRMVGSSGYFGIGTTSPVNALDIGTGGGIHIANGMPSSTSNALYNNGGILMWNGTAVGSGGSSISGTTNYFPYFTSSSTLGNSVMYQSAGKIGIGTISPAVSLDASQNTDALGLPSGSTAQRPSGTNGQIRYNSDLGGLEAYVNGEWVGLAGSASGSYSAGRLQCGGTDCSNTNGSTSLNYCPYKGNLKTTASQGNYTIPSGCLTASLTNMYINGTANSSVIGGTLYYVYLWNNSGTWILAADTTGHATDGTTGVEIKSGDNTKTLVGMLHTDANGKIMTGGQTNTPGDTNTVATWDNRQPTTTKCYAAGGSTIITNASEAEVDSTDRCLFMSWGDSLQFSSQQTGTPTSSAGTNLVAFVFLDAVDTNLVSESFTRAPTLGWQLPIISPAAFTAAEGFHTSLFYAAIQPGSGGSTVRQDAEPNTFYTVQ